MKFSEFLTKLIADKGQGSLADDLHIDASALSRFRSGHGCAQIMVVDRVLEIGQAEIISKQELKRLEDALEVVTDLWKDERKKKPAT